MNDFKKHTRFLAAQDLNRLGFNTPSPSTSALFTPFVTNTPLSPPDNSLFIGPTNKQLIDKSKGRRVGALKGQTINLTTSNYHVYVTREDQIPKPYETGRATHFGGRINGVIDKYDASGLTFSGQVIGHLDADKGLWVALAFGRRGIAPRTTMQNLGVVFGDYIAVRNPINGLTVEGILVDEGPASPERLVDVARGMLKAIQLKNYDGIVQIWKAR